MELFKKIRVNLTVNAVLTILIGVLFVLNPTGTGGTIALIAGIAILISGITDIIRYVSDREYGFLMSGSLFGGVLKCILGLFAVTHTGTIITLLSYILSVFVIIGGVNCLENATQLKRAEVSGWAVNMALSVAILIAGIFMLFFPFDAASTAITIVGIILIADGLNELFTAHRMRKINGDFKKVMKDIRDEFDDNIIDMP
ncbi:MAG: DUF308 domain-containing protein [Lachnospiraceae bacterium]|nr:DUF308 domain-containing protein [Lachnospiraceae bacterium]